MIEIRNPIIFHHMILKILLYFRLAISRALFKIQITISRIFAKFYSSAGGINLVTSFVNLIVSEFFNIEINCINHRHLHRHLHLSRYCYYYLFDHFGIRIFSSVVIIPIMILIISFK